MRTTSFLLLIMAVSAMTTSCAKTLLNDTAEIRNSPLLTKAVTPEEFDWETADWMPTPAGQSRISVPWIGQGSLTAFYGLDIVNDYKKQTDGSCYTPLLLHLALPISSTHTLFYIMSIAAP